MRRASGSFRVKMSKGFSLVEIIVALTVLSVIMIPVALMFIEYVRSVAFGDSQALASNLLQRELSIVSTIDYAALVSGNFANYAGYNVDLTRDVISVKGTGGNLKRVQLRIFPHGSSQETLNTVTYAIGMNIAPGPGSAGGALGDEGLSASVSLGSFVNAFVLSDIRVGNTRSTGNITMTGIKISATQARTMTGVRFNGEDRLESQVAITNEPSLVLFKRNFFMSSTTAYTGNNGGSFTFSGAVSSPWTVTIRFVFYDGSESVPYTWTFG